MRTRFVLCCLAGVFWMTFPARAIIDLYLYLDGIPGESRAAGYEDQIVVENFSMGIANSGAGTPAFSDLTFSKQLDKSSPILMLKCANGATIPSAVLSCRSITSGIERKFYIIRLTNVKVTQVSQGGGAGGGLPYDTFSLNYESIEWEYIPYDPSKGAPLAPVKTRWSL